MGSSRKPWATRRRAWSTSSARASQAWPPGIGCSVFSAEGAAQAELAVLSHWAPIPPSLDFPGAAGQRRLRKRRQRRGAADRGARRTGDRHRQSANNDCLRSLGAEPVAYGQGLAGRVRALVPGGVGAALDVAENGVGALLAPARPDLPARRGCPGAPRER